MLEQLMSLNLGKKATRVLELVINQLNLLLCLVNDVLDMKMIEQDKYEPKQERFSPQSILKFIVNMF